VADAASETPEEQRLRARGLLPPWAESGAPSPWTSASQVPRRMRLLLCGRTANVPAFWPRWASDRGAPRSPGRGPPMESRLPAPRRSVRRRRSGSLVPHTVAGRERGPSHGGGAWPRAGPSHSSLREGKEPVPGSPGSVRPAMSRPEVVESRPASITYALADVTTLPIFRCGPSRTPEGLPRSEPGGTEPVRPQAAGLQFGRVPLREVRFATSYCKCRLCLYLCSGQ